MLPYDGGGGNAEAKPDNNGKGDKRDAYTVGGIGLSAIVGNNREKRQKGELYDALLKHRWPADGYELACN